MTSLIQKLFWPSFKPEAGVAQDLVIYGVVFDFFRAFVNCKKPRRQPSLGILRREAMDDSFRDSTFELSLLVFFVLWLLPPTLSNTAPFHPSAAISLYPRWQIPRLLPKYVPNFSIVQLTSPNLYRAIRSYHCLTKASML